MLTTVAVSEAPGYGRSLNSFITWIHHRLLIVMAVIDNGRLYAVGIISVCRIKAHLTNVEL